MRSCNEKILNNKKQNSDQNLDLPVGYRRIGRGLKRLPRLLESMSVGENGINWGKISFSYRIPGISKFAQLIVASWTIANDCLGLGVHIGSPPLTRRGAGEMREMRKS